jgi:hypothetical protein
MSTFSFYIDLRFLWLYRTAELWFTTRVARWHIFKPKNPNLGKFWRDLQWKMSIYFMAFCQCLQHTSTYKQRIALFSLLNLYPGGIRTRVFCIWGGRDVHCATPPRKWNPFTWYEIAFVWRSSSSWYRFGVNAAWRLISNSCQWEQCAYVCRYIHVSAGISSFSFENLSLKSN